MLKPGMMLCDRYEILEVVGAGGMSIVYKARCHRLNRNVAIKVLKPEFSNDKNFVTKFKVEAQASAGLTHPNIVNVFDVYDDEGLYFIVMELVEGITLKQYIEEKGRLSMDQAIDFSMQIAAGLEAAHESHIIHRDIKPQNIIVAKNGNLKVTDFGIAKAASSNTLTSGAMGSVHYISPEQARGGYSDERSDIYSLGITMYEMVTGRVPFEGDNNVSVALMHIQGEMISPRQYYPDIYTSFEKIILKATQKKPERRYLTASALIADLKRVQNNPNIDIVVAPTAITNSPTQEWTKEDVQAIRDGASYREAHQEPYANAYTNNQLNTFSNPPIQNEMGELKPSSQPVVTAATSQKIDSLLNDDNWEDEFEDEPVVEPVRRGNLKKVQDYDDDPYEEDTDEIDPNLRKAVVIAGIATAVIIAIILMIVLGNVTGFFKFGKNKDKTTTETEETYEVPMIEVIGYSEDAAIKMLKNAGFNNVEVVTEENEEVQEGYVFDQNVKKDEMLDINETVTIYVSAGAEAVEVPDVTNYEDAQAVTVLKEAGFNPVHSYSFSDEIEKDHVIVTEPKAHNMAPKGSDVIITISNGSEIKEINMPNLNGLTESQARNSLSSAKLEVGTVKHDFSDTVPKDQVMSQNPAANTKVKEGTVVDFVISDGPEEKEKFYTNKVTGSISCTSTYNTGSVDGEGNPIIVDLNGQKVTIQIFLDGDVIRQEDWTVGGSYSVNAEKNGSKTQGGSASVTILYNGYNVTSCFSVSTNVSSSEEEH